MSASDAGNRQSPFGHRRYPSFKYKDNNRVRMAADKICSSCGKRLIGRGNTFFKCPKCGEYEIGRCAQCRDQSVSYECKKCGFIGP